MKFVCIVIVLVLTSFYACSPQINSFNNINEVVFWDKTYGLNDGTKSVYYVDSILVPSNYSLLYSKNSGYSYFLHDSVDVDTLDESKILLNNIASFEIMCISQEMGMLDDKLTKELFGNDCRFVSHYNFFNENYSKSNILKCTYDKTPSYYRILLIRGDYLNWRIFFSIQDGRFGRKPIQVIDPYAYYKVYVPIWN